MPDSSNDLVARFLTYLRAERSFSPHTVRNYQADLADFAAFAGKRRSSLLNASRRVVREYISALAVRSKPATVMRHKAALRTFYRFLQREGLVDLNPTSGLSSVRLPQKLPDVLSQREADNLLQSRGASREDDRVRDQAMAELLYATGLRVSELAGLNVDDVDLGRKQVLVRVGKGNKQRTVFFGEPAAAALVEYLGERGQWVKGQDVRAMFFGRRGRRISPRTVRAILDRWATRVGKPVHPHTLRHSFATHMLEKGADIRAIQELLGHASLSTTQKYTHLDLHTIMDAYKKAHPLEGETDD